MAAFALGPSMLALAWLLAWGMAGRAAAQEPLLVFVSVVPQKTFVERIGGDRVRVRAMVKSGHSPATYEPTPRQVAELARADLYIKIGVPFEDAWMPRLQAANPDMSILDARQGLRLRAADGHAHGDAEPGHADDLDPHVWTSPPLVKAMAGVMRDRLSELDPAGTKAFAAGYTAFAADLDALDLDLRRRLADVGNRHFMVFHPAWGYFAETYGLIQIPVERQGKETGGRALAALVDQARGLGIRIIFVQPQFDRKLAQTVAQSFGGRVEVLDPLAADYFGNLRRAASLIAQAADR